MSAHAAIVKILVRATHSDAERCKGFDRYKGLRKPRCGCKACMALYTIMTWRRG